VTALLATQGVHKSFGGVQALDACTLQIDEGTVAGLIGPNGSGKTTLFNVITGYAKAGRSPTRPRTRCSRSESAGPSS
jgi:neutral amino acid transport system ATP-binding protein